MIKHAAPVIIIGAGPVGLSMAIGLARQGIKSLVIEKHPTTTNHPKARGINTRTMEIFRSWGIETAVRQHQLPKEAHRFIWLESFQGKEITRVSAQERPASTSPTTIAIISQDWVEHELHLAAQQYPEITILFNTKLLKFDQINNGVTINVVNTNTHEQDTFECSYLIGADGAASFIRSTLNIPMQGEDNIGEFCNIYCEMDLTKFVKGRVSVGYIFTRKDIMGTVILSKDGEKKWLVGVRFDNNPELTKASFTDDFCVEIIKKIIDDDSVQVTLINKAFWTMAALIANNYRINNILLVGDAAHRLPPTGGLGMNTGIQDAHNLAWKLAAVLKGQAKETLLDTYQEERSPIAVGNIEWSTKNAMRFNTIFTALYEQDYVTMNKALEEQNEHVNQIGLDLGFRYESGALVKDHSPVPPPNTSTYTPSTYAGSRAPHYFLQNKEKNSISTLDLFGKNFVLLSSDATSDWHQAALAITDIPVQSYRIGNNGELQDPLNNWLETYQIGPEGAVLVRPDGHVAWRCIGGLQDAGKCLNDVIKKLL